MKCKVRVKLNKIPFDKFSDGKFVHATGDMCIFEDGTSVYEYEDDLIEDAEDCIYDIEEEY